MTLRETDIVLRGLTIDQKHLKDHMEAVGHKEDFVQDLVKDQVPLSESIVKQLHYLVLADKKDDCGVYRRVSVRIMGAKLKPVELFDNVERIREHKFVSMVTGAFYECICLMNY